MPMIARICLRLWLGPLWHVNDAVAVAQGSSASSKKNNAFINSSRGGIPLNKNMMLWIFIAASVPLFTSVAWNNHLLTLRPLVPIVVMSSVKFVPSTITEDNGIQRWVWRIDDEYFYVLSFIDTIISTIIVRIHGVQDTIIEESW